MNRLAKAGALVALAASAWALLAVLVAAAYLLLMMVLVSVGHAHDGYGGLQRDGTYGPSSPCCGNTDCHGIEWDDVTLHPDGSASFFIRGLGVSVLVAADRITPAGLPPDPVTKKVYPAHWCGKKRGGPIYSPFSGSSHQEIEPPTAGEPDPTFITWCAFLAPGGA